MDVLEQLIDKDIDEAEAYRQFPDQLKSVDADQPGTSKRKRAVLQAKARRATELGYKEGSWEYDAYMRWGEEPNELVTDPRRVATGRDARKITGVFDPSEAEAVFYEATSDTHGGKTLKHGKNSRYYIGKDGKPVRKK